MFRFKYRSRPILHSLFGNLIPSHGPPLITPTPSSSIAKAKNRLTQLPHDQLVDKMLKLQTKLAHKKSDSKDSPGKKEPRRRSEDQRTEAVAMQLTKNWVKQQSRGPSEKEKSKAGSVGKEKAVAKAAWDQVVGGGEAWGDAKW